MAILLVSVLIGLITRPGETTFGGMLLTLVQQLGVGLLMGLAAGRMLAWLLARIRLAEGLYALMIASGGILVFALANIAGGSGFLAVYLAGVLIGNARNSATEYVLNVMDGLAWLAQAVMFLVLGLLVTPSHLLEQGLHALLIAAFLILVARPLAVYSSIWRFRFGKRELAYISWVGLRGAVPVTLAMMPLMSGVPSAQLLFDVAFAVVILSLLIQGTTIPVFARMLGMVLPPKPEPQQVREIWLSDTLSVTLQSFAVEAGSDAEHSHPYAMIRDPAFSEGRPFALLRQSRSLPLDIATQMQAGDTVWYVLPPQAGEAFAEQFADARRNRDEQNFFGEFVVRPDAAVGDLALAYGLHPGGDINPSETLGSLFRRRFGSVPVAGDRIEIDGFFITVKELDGRGDIRQLGLKIPKKAA